MSDAGHSKVIAITEGGRRRYVAVLFADICGYTELSEGIDPEEIDQLRHQLESLALNAIGRHGGTVLQVYGDGILAVFGHPTPQEDDARRAVEAALELHEATRTASWDIAMPANFVLRMHSGVHAGLVFIRQGDALHGHYEISGDPVNTAARLCAASARDEILVSDTVLIGIEAFFSTEAGKPLLLKGKRAAIQAYRVTGRSHVQTRFDARRLSGLTHFVGREPELQRLQRLFLHASAGARTTAYVSGAPGIGKTRMLEEFRRRIEAMGARVLRGRCEHYGDTAALDPFRQVVAQLFAVSASDEPAAARSAVTRQLALYGSHMAEHRDDLLLLLGLARQPTDSPRSGTAVAERSQRVMHAIAQLLLTLSSREPLALILDDWQWADDASRIVLESFLGEAGPGRLCVVVGAREGLPEPALKSAEVFGLRPLSESECGAVIRTLRPGFLDVGITHGIYARTGGNPLFLEELCRSLPDHVVAGENVLEGGEVPTTLQGLIQARVDRLPTPMGHLLRVASVIGQEFSRTLLARVLPEHPVAELLEQLADGDLIQPTDDPAMLRFKHGITQAVIYESVRKAERRVIHRQIAQTVSQESGHERAELLAHHYRGAGDHEQAAIFAEVAGDRAFAASALDRARFHYTQALESLEQLGAAPDVRSRWLSIHARWAGAYVYAPSRKQLPTLEKGARWAEELGDASAQAYVAHWRCWIHYVLGEYDNAIDIGNQGLSLARTVGDERLATQLIVSLGQCHAAAGEHAQALTWLDQGIALKRKRAAGRSNLKLAQGHAYALGCRAAVYADRGDFDLADSDMAEALQAVEGTGHAVEASLLALVGQINIFRGDFQAAAEAASECRAQAERFNSNYAFAMGSVYEAYAHWELTRTPTALEAIRNAIAWLESRDTGLFSSLNYGLLSDAYASAGAWDDARDHAQRALRRSTERDPLGACLAHRALARAEAARAGHDSPAVGTHLQAAIAAAEAREALRDVGLTRLLQAELLRAEGVTPSQAEWHAREALMIFEPRGMHHHAALARKHLRPV